MPTASDIIPGCIAAYIESHTGHPLKPDEGVQHGCAETAVRSMMICWMATPDAIEEAGRKKVDLLIGHESLYYPYDAANRSDNPPGWQEWQVNRQRRELLDRYGLTFLRLHGSADEICIFDDFAALLELGAPLYQDGLVKIYEIAECSLGALIEHVKCKTGMAHLRVALAGGLDRAVRRIGLPWGGLGLFVNVGYQQRLVELGCDVFIAGESDNYGLRFAAECGIPMIETSHEISENPGLRHLAAILGQAFTGLAVHFYENRCIWQWA